MLKTKAMIAMEKNNPPRPVTEQEKQTQPMPGEVDPKDAKMKVFLAIQKAKQRLVTCSEQLSIFSGLILAPCSQGGRESIISCPNSFDSSGARTVINSANSVGETVVICFNCCHWSVKGSNA